MNTLGIRKAMAAGLIGLTALGGATAIVPSIADAQDAQVPPAEEDREANREERQANRAERRSERISVLTGVLGISEDALQVARESGQSIADVAAAQGVPVDDVLDVIVASRTARIQARVDAGDLTQAEADERIAGLVERITERVNTAPGERGPGGRHGHGPRGGDAGADA